MHWPLPPRLCTMECEGRGCCVRLLAWFDVYVAGKLHGHFIPPLLLPSPFLFLLLSSPSLSTPPPLPSPILLLLFVGPDTDPSECKVTRQAVGKDLLKMKDTQFTFWSWFYQARELVISCLKQEWEAG